MKTDNTLPSGIYDLLRLGEQMADGLTLHGPDANAGRGIRAVLERLRKAETLLAEARVAKAKAGGESTAADAALLRWLVRAKCILIFIFGGKWSERWLEGGSLIVAQMCRSGWRRAISLARGVTGFLARNQEYELAALQVTGEDGREVLGRMLTAPKELRAAAMECAAKKRTRDALERTLRRKMRQVVVILGVTIRAQDGRWLAFGLNRPARSAGVRRPILSTSEPGEMIALPQSPERAAEVLPEATAA